MKDFEIVDKILVKYTGKRGIVEIPEGVKIIGEYAFCGSSITSVKIPNSVKGIDSRAFYNCCDLTSITIPDSVKKIGTQAFYCCSKLTSITIPDSVESIERSAFEGCIGLKQVTIGDGVTSIGNSAFYQCIHLTSVTIGSGVTSIRNSAFEGCYDLNSVHYTGDVAGWCGIKFGSSDANPLCYAYDLYLNGTLLTELVIPDTVTEINDYAFYGCSSLTSATIPSSVKSIGAWTFCRSKLASITINNGVESIGRGAFCHCTELTSIAIPKSVTWIGDTTFYHCAKLTSVAIPDGITSIGQSAFELCSELISKKANYKAFCVTEGKMLMCRDTMYIVGEKSEIEGNLKLCNNGIHYCTNLFDIFNYYSGGYGSDFVIGGCEVSDENIGGRDDSKRRARWIIPTKILTRKEVIKLLNNNNNNK